MRPSLASASHPRGEPDALRFVWELVSHETAPAISGGLDAAGLRCDAGVPVASEMAGKDGGKEAFALVAKAEKKLSG